jgi:hypothetical protein
MTRGSASVLLKLLLYLYHSSQRIRNGEREDHILVCGVSWCSQIIFSSNPRSKAHHRVAVDWTLKHGRTTRYKLMIPCTEQKNINADSYPEYLMLCRWLAKVMVARAEGLISRNASNRARRQQQGNFCRLHELGRCTTYRTYLAVLVPILPPSCCRRVPPFMRLPHLGFQSLSDQPMR